ncbi:MAG: hypothetical protein Q8P93_03020 [bacterium]|nr:hypothetical protein [bacterium]
MSIDVTYHSFSPSRADLRWSHFIEDFLVLRKRHAPYHQHKQEEEDFKRQYALLSEKANEPVIKARKRIFDFFDKKGYVIPWIDWDKEEGTDRYGDATYMSDENKMEYLSGYGCVYPRGADLSKKDGPYLMLRMHAPQLLDDYYKSKDERDAIFKEGRSQKKITPAVDSSVVLNERQEEIESVAECLIYNTGCSEEDVLCALKKVDIFYGSVVNDFFEDSKIERSILEAIIEGYALVTQEGFPTRSEWIRLYANRKGEGFRKAVDALDSEFDWMPGDAEYLIKDFFRSIAPVVKDLEETPDALFMRVYDIGFGAEPASVEQMLTQRVLMHRERYRGQLPPVL